VGRHDRAGIEFRITPSIWPRRPRLYPLQNRWHAVSGGIEEKIFIMNDLSGITDKSFGIMTDRTKLSTSGSGN
jgi:hypothetical protein